MEFLGYLLALGMALLVTCLLEGAAVFCLDPWRRWLAVSLCANFLTNPAINLLLWGISALFPQGGAVYWCSFVGLELLVVGVEGWIYARWMKQPRKKCVLISLAANVLSCGVGLLVF